MAYDNAGNMLQQFDGKNNVTEVQYNVRGLPKTRIDGAGLAETYTYYANGAMHTKTDRNTVITTYMYDIFGRIACQTAGQESISYTYDDNGNQLTMTDSSGTTERTYDELGRVLTKTVPVFGTSAYEYDILDRAMGEYSEKTTDPAGNITIKGYDKAGRLVSVKDSSDAEPTTYTYDGIGRKSSIEYPNGAETQYTYDDNNRLTQLINSGTENDDIYTYTYDNAGNQLTKHEVVNGTDKGTTTYEYDALSRLKKVFEPGNKETTYTYDAAGNRTDEVVTESGTITKNAHYDYNAQNRISGYTYDNNGNILSNGESSFTYDELNRMKTTTASEVTTSYGYNGDGYRVSKTSGEETTYYLYEADKVILEQDSSGTTVRNVYGTNLISRSFIDKKDKTINARHIMRIMHINTAFYQYNGHADVTRISDFNGNCQEYTYDAFGNILTETGSGDVGENPFRYAGYRYDNESGLYYLNARYYDPKTARFMSEDGPGYIDANDPLSLNLYTYCSNNPVKYWDPSGRIATGNSPVPDDLDWDDDGNVDTPADRADMDKNGDGIADWLQTSTGSTNNGKGNTSSTGASGSLGIYTGAGSGGKPTNLVNGSDVSGTEPEIPGIRGSQPGDLFENQDDAAIAAALFMYNTHGDSLFDEERMCWIYELQGQDGKTYYTFDTPRNDIKDHPEKYQRKTHVNSCDAQPDTSIGKPVAWVHNHPNSSNSFSYPGNSHSGGSGDSGFSDREQKAGYVYLQDGTQGRLKKYTPWTPTENQRTVGIRFDGDASKYDFIFDKTKDKWTANENILYNELESRILGRVTTVTEWLPYKGMNKFEESMPGWIRDPKEEINTKIGYQSYIIWSKNTTVMNEYTNPDKNGNQQRGISKDTIKRIADLMQEVLDGKRGVNFNKK